MCKRINAKNIFIGLVVIVAFIFLFLLYILFSKVSFACLGITNCQEWINQDIFFNMLLISWVSTLIFIPLILNQNKNKNNKFLIFRKKICIFYIIANVVFLFIMINSYAITTNEYIEERKLYNFFSKEIYYWKDIEAYGIKKVELRRRYSTECRLQPYLILKTGTIIPLWSQTREIPTPFIYYLKNKLPEKKMLEDECNNNSYF